MCCNLVLCCCCSLIRLPLLLSAGLLLLLVHLHCSPARHSSLRMAVGSAVSAIVCYNLTALLTGASPPLRTERIKVQAACKFNPSHIGGVQIRLLASSMLCTAKITVELHLKASTSAI